jgi:hypothetical protein
MALQVWCLQHGCVDLGIKVCPVPTTGGVHKMWEQAPRWARVPRPQPGTLYLFDHGHGLGHVGIHDFTDNEGWLHGIEGNTLPDVDTREARRGGVYEKMYRLDADGRIVPPGPHKILGYLHFDLHQALDAHEPA